MSNSNMVFLGLNEKTPTTGAPMRTDILQAALQEMGIIAAQCRVLLGLLAQIRMQVWQDARARYIYKKKETGIYSFWMKMPS